VHLKNLMSQALRNLRMGGCDIFWMLRDIAQSCEVVHKFYGSDSNCWREPRLVFCCALIVCSPAAFSSSVENGYNLYSITKRGRRITALPELPKLMKWGEAGIRGACAEPLNDMPDAAGMAGGTPGKWARIVVVQSNNAGVV
jgi:hypothetical protein